MTQNDVLLGSKLSTISGVLGVLGSFLSVATNLIGIIVVEQHNPISETISMLAIGEYAWLQDFGLDALALGLAAIAVALIRWNLGGLEWQAGATLVMLLSLDILLIAEHNQYVGREGVGAAIHIYCVYALGLLVALMTWFLSRGLGKVGRGWRRFSRTISLVWTVFGPIFFFVPDGWNGAYERFVALILLTWVVAVSWLLIRHGDRARSEVAT
ncbi:MAG: DUF998 domain-containing protein [Elainellaceae cyanobacterium]